MNVMPISHRVAGRIAAERHYLHRRPPISHAFALVTDGSIDGIICFGVPASPHLTRGACPSDPSIVLELNRLWVDDRMPRNTESWFIARALALLPPRIVVSYADLSVGHEGIIYRAANFRYAGWTDMDRPTPRLDYVAAQRVTDGGLGFAPPREPHTREATRSGTVEKRRRTPKVKYWTATGTASQRRALVSRCGWPSLDWTSLPPPRMDEAGR